MPKSNLTGGKHHKKAKKHRNTVEHETRLEYAGVNQIYASVKKRLGGSRLLVICSDGKERSATIPGKFRRKTWMNAGDIILCNLGIDCNDTCCFIIYKYSNKEASLLKSQGKIDFEIIQDKEDQLVPNDSSEEYDDWSTDEEGNPIEYSTGHRPIIQRKLEFPPENEETEEEEDEEDENIEYSGYNNEPNNNMEINKLNKMINNL